MVGSVYWLEGRVVAAEATEPRRPAAADRVSALCLAAGEQLVMLETPHRSRQLQAQHSILQLGLPTKPATPPYLQCWQLLTSRQYGVNTVSRASLNVSSLGNAACRLSME